MPKVVIIGAGVAGTIASSATSAYSPSVLERKSKADLFQDHHAVLRIRDPRTALLLGCDIKPIRIKKEIFYDGRLHNECTIVMNNLYSLKTSESIGTKSIMEAGMHERFILEGSVAGPSNASYECTLEGVEKGILRTDRDVTVSYNYCISTIPLPTMARIAGLVFDATKFRTNPIVVWQAESKVASDVHQTIYFPELEFKTYRATLEGRRFVLEATDIPSSDEINHVLLQFGLGLDEMKERDLVVQQNGKLVPADDQLRRSLIYQLTDRFNVFSLGRYAIWKPLRIDDLVDDIERIKRMMMTHDRYEIQKERSQSES